MGIKYFRSKGRGIKPQEIIKQNRRVDKLSESTISAENNLKPTAVLRNPDTNSGGCIVSTNTTWCITFIISWDDGKTKT